MDACQAFYAVRFTDASHPECCYFESGYHPAELGAAVCDALIERTKVKAEEAAVLPGQGLATLSESPLHEG